MSSIVITGGKHLSGTISVNGAKNGALPLLAASLLTRKPVQMDNVPQIKDVKNIIQIMTGMGVAASQQGDRVIVQAKDIDPFRLPNKVVGELRGSILMLGALLGRFGEAHLPQPGGDVIGARPIDVHLDALEQLGATISRRNNLVHVDGRGLKAGRVVLQEFSVTATENVMMVAATLPGYTIINIAANEPHVVKLAEMLTMMGATVEGAGTHTICIRGCENLKGAKVRNTNDMLEAGLFILMAAATKSELTITNVPLEDLTLFFKKLDEIGIDYTCSEDTVKVHPAPLKSFHLQTLPHPGIATDLQAPFSVVATQAKGASLIHDPMYESRFRHCDELAKMGASITVCDPHRVIVDGPTQLRGQHIKSLDIRSGATLVLAGIVAKGQTIIDEAEIIERGYADLVERLRAVGADIKRVGESDEKKLD
ncbi:MAG: UDP-N-acetylglucosamine 1-carboxyvinyltransferase [Candidatus Andersenbacteria bacterium RIFCSPHIGHO2_12_FULL_46_9]|nr:MAG: UDP-N-acetylglucosamine 1-carboxyvinyltransferase [Candidatus Andersenbacteria bacterium RIFCSPHIGHO2_02_FULL_46_16]OGY35934.1 MAG: UDP-N-acetylglucosamine 1-carboxyvinyltransferase [Candidatus Andersenbacteria bacterium RIFCSPHIGHO2_12_FULL_46_9]OGY38155.1 MAG: UDP-N-acetylglucosamine 1-carboxyvinyltransferase [Candidatus Andersenbacteria bacterium RIFCSPLOWO2_02_FULL_46_11]